MVITIRLRGGFPDELRVSVHDWDRRSTPVYRVRRCGSRPIKPNRWPVPCFVRWFWCALKCACCRSFASTGTKRERTAPNTSAQWMQFTSTRTAHGMNFRNGWAGHVPGRSTARVPHKRNGPARSPCSGSPQRLMGRDRRVSTTCIRMA